MSNFGLIGFPKHKPLDENRSTKLPLEKFQVDYGRSPSSYAPGFLGVFGFGMYAVYRSNGIFPVPNYVTKLRVRLVGAGGGGAAGGTGGAGGGFALGEFDVAPNSVFNLSVPATGGSPGTMGINGGLGTAGGVTSFGNLISATGGQGGTAPGSSPTPGEGIGGDIQTKGGTTAPISGTGGGGAGSQLGTGGTALSTGGAGLVHNAYATYGSGPFGERSAYFGDTSAYTGAKNPLNLIVRFPFDGFVGGTFSTSSGDGMGGNATSAGAAGGGGGGSVTSDAPGPGGIGGGGGGTTTAPVAAQGGGGLIIVEY